VAPSTFGERLSGKHQSRKVAYESQRLLDSSQDKVLNETIALAAEQATPLDRNAIRGLVEELTGKTPGKHWDARWSERQGHVKSTASGLDPKRGANFTPEKVSEFFDMLEDLNQEFGEIPPEQIWNMDEKGIQLGGGRKNAGRKFTFPGFSKRRNRYKLASDNLELVTVLECVSAAGESIPPSFVVKGPEGSVPDLRDVKGDWGGQVV
jgi:hypothetical protein